MKLKSLLKALLVACLCFSFISCQTITIRPDGKAGKLTSPPDYQETRHFFFGGVWGEAVIPAGKICMGKKVRQLQSQTTFWNGLIPGLIRSGGAFWATYFGIKAIIEDSPASFVGALLTGSFVILASLIYVPKTAKVWCEKHKTAQEDGGGRLLEAI